MNLDFIQFGQCFDIANIAIPTDIHISVSLKMEVDKKHKAAQSSNQKLQAIATNLLL
jgi:hypothetical protein